MLPPLSLPPPPPLPVPQVRPSLPHHNINFKCIKFLSEVILSLGPRQHDSDESAVDEGASTRKRPRSYSASDLNPEQKAIIQDLLLKKKASNPNEYAMECTQVVEHLEAYHPHLAKLVSLRSLQRWRNKLSAPVYGPAKKRGAPAVLPHEHRLTLGALLKEMGKAGSPMNWVLAKPVILGYLEEKGLKDLYSEKPQSGKISLGHTWVNDLFLEFNLPSRKQTTDAQSLPEVPFFFLKSGPLRDLHSLILLQNWEELKLKYNYRVAYAASLYSVPADLIFALDQYGQRLLAVGDRTRVEKGTKSVSVLGAGDKRQITGVPIVSMAGCFVGVQAIWQGTTDRCHPKRAISNPKLFHTHSENHWSTPESMRHLVVSILRPYIDDIIEKMPHLNAVQKINQKSLLLLDVWKHHLSVPFRELLASKHIIPVYLDPGATSKEQVGDLVVNRTMKTTVTEVISTAVAKSVAKQLKARDLLRGTGASPCAISIDVKMGALKPLVVEGMVKAIKFFESDEGRKLIIKGFAKAGLDKCHDPAFIARAGAWAQSAGLNDAVLNPVFTPAENNPPNVAADVDDPIALVTALDEEMMDLVEEDSMDVSDSDE